MGKELVSQFGRLPGLPFGGCVPVIGALKKSGEQQLAVVSRNDVLGNPTLATLLALWLPLVKDAKDGSDRR